MENVIKEIEIKLRILSVIVYFNGQKEDTFYFKTKKSLMKFVNEYINDYGYKLKTI